jgi:transcription antitermination factor NusG
MKSAWHVFYTSSRHERKCELRLSSEGYIVFVPLIDVMRQWSDRTKKVKAPLFPGYIFVKCNENQVATVSGFQGIVGPLRFADGYAQVREHEIKAIKLLISTGAFAEAVTGDVTIGDKVVIDDGPLKGIEGKCVMEGGSNYMYVEVASIDQSIRFKLPAGLLRKIE